MTKKSLFSVLTTIHRCSLRHVKIKGISVIHLMSYVIKQQSHINVKIISYPVFL